MIVVMLGTKAANHISTPQVKPDIPINRKKQTTKIVIHVFESSQIEKIWVITYIIDITTKNNPTMPDPPPYLIILDLLIRPY